MDSYLGQQLGDRCRTARQRFRSMRFSLFTMIWNAEIDHALETVVAVDNATVRVIQVGGREAPSS